MPDAGICCTTFAFLYFFLGCFVLFCNIGGNRHQISVSYQQHFERFLSGAAVQAHKNYNVKILFISLLQRL